MGKDVNNHFKKEDINNKQAHENITELVIEKYKLNHNEVALHNHYKNS